MVRPSPDRASLTSTAKLGIRVELSALAGVHRDAKRLVNAVLV
jgi:hypothetical protein